LCNFRKLDAEAGVDAPDVFYLLNRKAYVDFRAVKRKKVDVLVILNTFALYQMKDRGRIV
jgi:hypothetical protein